MSNAPDVGSAIMGSIFLFAFLNCLFGPLVDLLSELLESLVKGKTRDSAANASDRRTAPF